MATIVPLFTNAFSTTLASSVASGATTSFSLSSVTGLPTIGTDQYVPAVVVDASTTPETVKEYVHITAVSGTTATVVRAAEDATRFPAAALASGLVVAAVVTKGALLKQRPRYGTVSGQPAAATLDDGELYVVTDDATYGKSLYQVQSGSLVQVAALPLAGIQELSDVGTYGPTSSTTQLDTFSFTFNAPATTFSIEGVLKGVKPTVAGDYGRAFITDGSNTTLGASGVVLLNSTNAAANHEMRVTTKRLTGYTIGASTTVKLRMSRPIGTGTITATGASPGTEHYIRVIP